MINNMKLNISAKKIQINQSFTDYAEKRLKTKLDKFFPEEAEYRITLTNRKNMMICELTLSSGGLIFRAEQEAQDKNTALDACIDRIIRQIRKNKTKVEKKLHSTIKENFEDDIEEQVDFEVVKHKRFKLRPMSVDEAILQMNMLGHSFFMFKNGENGDINVVYRRDDGNYAVLEPEE